MTDELIQRHRDNVYTEFNSQVRPWRLYTSNIYHDPSLITDTSYIAVTSGYDAYSNTLNIEASGSDINFYTSDNYKTYFNNNICAVKDVSINRNLDVSGNISAEKFIGDGTLLRGTGSLALQEIKDCSFGFIEVSNLEVFIAASFNNRVDISNLLKVYGDVSFNGKLDVSGDVVAEKFIGDGSELTSVGLLVLQEANDCSFGIVEMSNLVVLNNSYLKNTLEVLGDVSFNSKLEVSGSIDFKSQSSLQIYCVETSGTSLKIYDKNAAKTRFNITADGSVGIGTDSPAAKLEVVGNIQGGTSKIGSSINNGKETALFGHKDMLDISNCAVAQMDGAETIINCKQGESIRFTMNGGRGISAPSIGDQDEMARFHENGYLGIGKIPSSQLDVSGLFRAGYDTDSTHYIGRAALGYTGRSNWAGFSHLHQTNITNYALLQSATGITIINAAPSQHIEFKINDVEKMRLTADGSFGIATNDPTEKLSVLGNVIANGYLNFSDDRIKFDKKNIENGLDIIKNLTPKLYNKSESIDSSLNIKKEAGFIAQEVLLINDLSFVIKGGSENMTDKLYSLDYGSIFAFNVAATKELDNLVTDLSNEVYLLKQEKDIIKGALNKLLEEGGHNKIL